MYNWVHMLTNIPCVYSTCYRGIQNMKIFIQKSIHLHTHIVTMAHTQCHGVDPVDLETEEIIPPYCPHGEKLLGIDLCKKFECIFNSVYRSYACV